MNDPAVIDPRTAARLRRWQIATASLMVAGYAGYYLCRSDYSVALPLLIAELTRHGMSPARAQVALGLVASAGVLAYALGKFPAGWLADRSGGRRNFLGGMGGAIAFTLLFAASGTLPFFTLAWIGNRLTQSLGWGGMVRIASRWFPGRAYGTVCAVLSLSFLFGDAASRAFLAALLEHGVGRRGLFVIAAAALTLLLLANWALLRESPAARGLPEPAAPAMLTPVPLAPEIDAAPLRLLSGNRVFWLACALSLGMTVLRETFNTWTPTFFTQAAGFSPAAAAARSALFPLLGGVSVLLVGVLSDRFGRRGRAAMIVAGMLLSTVLLAALANAPAGRGALLPVVLVAAIGFAVIGPYSFMAGAVALDLGGRRAGATASGVIDGCGYLGSVLADPSVAAIAARWGWHGAFSALAVLALLTALLGLAFWRSIAVE